MKQQSTWAMHAAVLALLLAGAAFDSAHAASWTKGHKRVLVIPVKFTDRAGPTDAPDPNGLSGWGNMTNGITPAVDSNFFVRQSYNQFTVDYTILPEVDLGVPTSYYTNYYPGTTYQKWSEWGLPGSLADDARAKARAIGLTNGQAALYESDNYDLDIIACGYNTYLSGASSDGGRTVIAFNFNALAHELCHCLGLQHANGTSRASMYSPVRRDSYFSYFYDAYGDVYDLMGYKMNTRTASPPPSRDINPYFKYELGWLTDYNISTPGGTSGTYRIYAFDQGSTETGKLYALRIPRDASYTYWFDLRRDVTNLPDSKWSQNGLEVHFGGESVRATSGTTMLWDTTPGSRGYTGTNFVSPGSLMATMHDAPLQIGRTYSDAEAGIHVTPIRKGGTTPESLDVVVNLGTFPGNVAPTLSVSPPAATIAAGVTQTFTAVASDADGDTLAYYWEFDDNTTLGGTDFGGLNGDARFATNGAHAWTQNGENFVRCTVTDMKGHSKTVSATVTVTNGTVTPITVNGVVKDELGNTLEGAVVNNFRSGFWYGHTNFAGSSMTAADGKFRIAVPRTNFTYVLSVLYKGYTFTNTQGGTVGVFNASISNVNFTRVRATRTLSGGVIVGGRGYDSPTDGNLWISDGTQSNLVVGGGWQLSVADGSLVTLTAFSTNPNCIVSSDFPKPYLVVDDCFTLSFFVDILGAEKPQAGFASTGTNTDDTAGSVTIPVYMNLPTGMTNWPSDQWFSYKIDESSTADYGVDYKSHGGQIVFFGNGSRAPYPIPLTVIHDGVPKHKTVVFTLEPASSVVSVGPIITFTYTIFNPLAKTHLSRAAFSNGVVSFSISNLTAAATSYVLRCTDLVSPSWSTVQTFTGMSGETNWSETFSNGWQRVFYKMEGQ